MTNIKFPETNVVGVKFTLRQNRAITGVEYNEYDHMRDKYIKDQKKYIYRVPDGMVGHLRLNDIVVVHCATGYQLCEIVELNVLTDLDISSLASIVCKVDLQPYIDEVERKKQLAAMKKQIEAEKKRLEAMVTYELIAEKNPGFKELLEAFKAMGGEF